VQQDDEVELEYKRTMARSSDTNELSELSAGLREYQRYYKMENLDDK